MITATAGIETYKVDGLANRGSWFGETWLLGIGMGYDTCFIVVEADNKTDAIDALTDSRYGHLIKTNDTCEFCAAGNYDKCTCSFAGNASERINTDEIRVFSRCKVNYFAKQIE